MLIDISTTMDQKAVVMRSRLVKDTTGGMVNGGSEK